MKNRLIILAVFCLSSNIVLAKPFAEKSYVEQEFLNQQERIEQVEQNFRTEFEQVRQSLQVQKDTMNVAQNKFETKIQNLNTKLDNLNVSTNESVHVITGDLNKLSKTQNVDRQTSKQELGHFRYWVLLALWGLLFGTLLVLLISLILMKKMKNRLANLDASINEKFLSLNLSQANVLDKLCGEMKQTSGDDHTLALKVADEIVLMERNMSFMDPAIKGYKQLKRSLATLKDKLNAQGYEMPELLGKKFDAGMKLTVVSSFPTDTLPHGEEIISKIIKPQVNFRGKMIQSAQIEVSIGE